MNKNELIKETLKDLRKINSELLMIKKSEFLRKFGYHQDISKFDEKLEYSLELFEYVDTETLNLMIKLNRQLKIEDRDKQLFEVEKQIRKIQSKKNITVKEFEEIYNVSLSSQRDYRSKLKDPLPYHQKKRRGKIVYVVDEVEKWFDNQYK